MNRISELLTYERIYSTRILITLFIDWQKFALVLLGYTQLTSSNKIEKNAKPKIVD